MAPFWKWIIPREKGLIILTITDGVRINCPSYMDIKIEGIHRIEMRKKEKTVLFRCDGDLFDSLEKASKIYQGSKSEMIRNILNLWVLETGAQRGELEKQIDIDGEVLYYQA